MSFFPLSLQGIVREFFPYCSTSSAAMFFFVFCLPLFFIGLTKLLKNVENAFWVTRNHIAGAVAAKNVAGGEKENEIKFRDLVLVAPCFWFGRHQLCRKLEPCSRVSHVNDIKFNSRWLNYQLFLFWMKYTGMVSRQKTLLFRLSLPSERAKYKNLRFTMGLPILHYQI